MPTIELLAEVEILKNKLKEKDKILNIIIKKRVNMDILCLSKDAITYENLLNYRMGDSCVNSLTQEEFVLIKEYIKKIKF